VEIIETETPQRVFSEYEVPKGTTLLEAIEVRASRMVQEDTDYRVRRPYGKPDVVLTAKDLTTGYGNLLYTLPGKVPGLIVRQISIPDEPIRWVVYLQRTTSIMFPGEVLVMVNNSIVGGSPADILGNINPDNVESIEVKKGVNVLFGFYGSNGVLAIYTKEGSAFQKESVRIPTLKTSGYDRPRKFRFPNYDDQGVEHPVDYRARVYWNPDVVTDASTGTATVSFYTTDLPGKYNVIAEGVAQNGKPVRCVSHILVD